MTTPRVFVFKATEKDTGWPLNMWIGFCWNCSLDTRYWSWGATLGHMLEHRYIGCEGEKLRERDRLIKYNRVPADEARLSCGGRTHGIMGEDRRDSIRRSQMSSDVSPTRIFPSQEARNNQDKVTLRPDNRRQ